MTALEEAGEVSVEGRVAGRLDGTSVVRLRETRAAGSPAEPAALRAAIEAAPGWSGALPDLVSTTVDGQSWVADFIRLLGETGKDQVRVSDLVSALAARVRADWDARNAISPTELGFEGGEDEIARLVRIVRPDATADERERFEMWRRAVPERIARTEDASLRERLLAEFEVIVRLIEGGNVPSQSDLIRELRLTKSTVSRDFARLREIMEEIAGGAGTTAPEGS